VKIHEDIALHRNIKKISTVDVSSISNIRSTLFFTLLSETPRLSSFYIRYGYECKAENHSKENLEGLAKKCWNLTFEELINASQPGTKDSLLQAFASRNQTVSSLFKDDASKQNRLLLYRAINKANKTGQLISCQVLIQPLNCFKRL
jgi:hypothetical protein